jgi:hypothetical protein
MPAVEEALLTLAGFHAFRLNDLFSFFLIELRGQLYLRAVFTPEKFLDAEIKGYLDVVR